MADSSSSPSPEETPHGFVRLRPRLIASLLMLLLLGYGGHRLWQHYAPAIGQHPQYAIPPDRITITPQPPWIQADVRDQVLRDAGLVGSLSVLDASGQVRDRIQAAFEFHPWVHSVQRITKRLPAAIDIELVYRRPIAAIELNGPRGEELLLTDAEGVRLPETEFPSAERQHLPRIVGNFDRPQIGQPWNHPTIQAGVKLANALAHVWQPLRLFEIAELQTSPAASLAGPTIEFEVLTWGGTRVVWGAAPGDEPPGESPFQVKLGRLTDYAAQRHDLHSINGPKALDVRGDLIVIPREARAKEDARTAQNPDVR